MDLDLVMSKNGIEHFLLLFMETGSRVICIFICIYTVKRNYFNNIIVDFTIFTYLSVLKLQDYYPLSHW